MPVKVGIFAGLAISSPVLLDSIALRLLLIRYPALLPRIVQVLPRALPHASAGIIVSTVFLPFVLLVRIVLLASQRLRRLQMAPMRLRAPLPQLYALEAVSASVESTPHVQ